MRFEILMRSLKNRAPALIGVTVALTIVLYTMVISTVCEIGSPRYRTPTDLLILFSIAVGIDLGRRACRGASARGLAVGEQRQQVPAPLSPQVSLEPR